MWKNIKSLYNRVHSPIKLTNPYEVPVNFLTTITSGIYYTPKLQRIPFSEELGKYLRYLNRKDKITNVDLRKLTEAIVT